MPFTYNGVGTHYYGRKNLQTRPGVCPHCGRSVLLESYDTRLFFVVVFIPVLPLGRKRIIDKCPSCKRHYVASGDKWETSKQLEISGAMDAFRANPNPETAIAAHRQMLNFHERDEAAKFAQTIAQQFADSAKLQAYLGAAQVHLGQLREAAPFFQRALELRPDLPEARIGVAEEKIRQRKLDEARQLLDFLQQPGAAQLYSLEPLEQLARAYQQAGRHEEALALFATLQEALPTLGQVKAFRKLVQSSEKALGRTPSQLPKKKFSWRGLWSRSPGRGFNARSAMLLGIGVALVLLGFLIANEYIRRHRPVYVVNAYRQPATVVIDGSLGVSNVRGVKAVVVSEGAHHAHVTGPVQEDFDFEVRTNYFDRWGDDPVWIVNVGGAAILESVTAHYSAHPAPGSFAMHYGRDFEYLPNVTHPFQGLPKSITANSGEERTLVNLTVFNGSGEGLVSYYVERKDLGQALGVAETWLKTHPEDEMMLNTLVGLSRSAHAESRVEAFLRAGLEARPISIPWHRAYQTMHDKPGAHADLVTLYQRWLDADPNSSALTYLRARLEPDRKQARRLFERSAELDAKNPYPLYALGYDRMTAGDWPAAEQRFAEAAKLRPGEALFDRRLVAVRLAVHRAILEPELRHQLSTDPTNAFATYALIDLLAMEQRTSEIPAAIRAFEQAVAKYGTSGKSAVQDLKRRAAYLVGDFPEMARLAGKDPSPDATHARFIATLEQGQLSAAEAAWPGAASDPGAALALSIAHRQAGDASRADALLGEASKTLANASFDEAQLAAVLQRSGPPTLDELRDLSIEPSLKALATAALVARYPQSATTLVPFIQQLNVAREFPYFFLQRFTSSRH